MRFMMPGVMLRVDVLAVAVAGGAQVIVRADFTLMAVFS
jgi:hypothetical protein